ncbi:SEL1-like repeat protein [Histomonas meleagridis]|uniref:SEL1-like repeat protein n=1 Tax=Histomonas meleagridis TaxID=135588 RepID=UPI00355A292E|nr:SEL1-like repeat protein [Histomonas meleagridis]KAH0800092.1 SEL1-like repeat protein [Histomonas meleagridis]
MAYIQHPAIIGLKGYSVPAVDSMDTPTIATEYMKNGTLLDILMAERNGRAPRGWGSTQKSIVMFGVAAGMMCIHRCNGIHRDLKPANILLDENYEPRIADFGLSKIQNSEALQSIVGGTPLWMAPELFLETQYTNKVDVFAYGMILYQMLTDRLPFDGKLNPLQIGNAILNNERPEISGNVPQFFSNLICECWSQNPADRPTFDDIVFKLANTHTIIIGTNIPRYKQYQSRILQTMQPQPSAELLSQVESQQQSFNNNFQQTNYSNNNSYQQQQQQSQTQQQPQKQHHKPSLKQMAKRGDINAMYKYGVKLIKAGDDRKAARYIVTAARSGHLDALMLSAKFYEDGKGVTANETQAAYYYKKAADAGNKEAQYKCGDILEFGKGVKQNIDKAIYFYKLASEQNHIEAALALGRIYSKNGNLQEALTYYEKAANLGNQNAALLAGKIAEKVCPEKALQYYETAMKHGSVEAAYECGLMIENGIGQPQKDIQKAQQYYSTAAKGGYQKAIDRLNSLRRQNSQENNEKTLTIEDLKNQADAGDAEAAYKVGVYLMDKPNASQNTLRYAAIYLNKANNADAQYRCGLLLEKGMGVKLDLQKAAYFYKLAADNGSIEALYHLSVLLHNGNGIPKDEQLALQYLKLAADKGHLNSQLFFAYYAENGIGMNVNPRLAATYYKMAADQGSPEALCSLGVMAQTGRGMPQNPTLAAECYQKAASLGYTLGQYNYAIMLQSGEGVPKNLVEAAKYYKLAADKGYADAQCNYAILMSSNNTGLQKDLNEAKYYAKLSAEAGNATGQCLYAQLLIIVDNNKSDAIKYFKMSAAQGNKRAQRKLRDMGIEN